MKLFDEFVYDALQTARIDHDTRAYVTNTITHLKPTSIITGSIVLEFLAASQQRKFEQFQRIGDWVLCAGVMFHENIAQNDNVVFGFGMKSYSACNDIVMGSWPVFKTLSHELPNVVEEARASLAKLSLI